MNKTTLIDYSLNCSSETMPKTKMIEIMTARPATHKEANKYLKEAIIKFCEQIKPGQQPIKNTKKAWIDLLMTNENEPRNQMN